MKEQVEIAPETIPCRENRGDFVDYRKKGVKS